MPHGRHNHRTDKQEPTNTYNGTWMTPTVRVGVGVGVGVGVNGWDVFGGFDVFGIG